MAREHARILCSIWRPGDDFRDRSPEAQRLYFLIVSQRELNNAGVAPLMVNKWARCSAGTSVEDIETALVELEEARYVVVDRDTEELLVRTFIRNDGVAKQPNVLKSALRLAEQIESETLRVALARELVRLGHRDAMVTASVLDPDGFAGLAADPSVNPFINPSSNPSDRPEMNPSSNPSAEPDSNPSPSPAGWGGGRGGGRGKSEGGQVGETPARPSERCRKHAGVEADGPCGGCGAARKAAARWDAERVDVERRARASWRSAVDACDECDENGKLELPDGSLRRHHEFTEAAS